MTSQLADKMLEKEESEELLMDLDVEVKYKNWRKNAPYFYNTIYTQSLTWPSLTVQWLPDHQLYKADGYSINRILYATDTSSTEQEYVIIGKVKLPYHSETAQSETNKSEKNLETTAAVGLNSEKNDPKVQIYSMIKHDGQVNRARYNPFNSKMVATKSSDHAVYVFNYIQHSKEGVPNNNSLKLSLSGHEDEGFGLSWSELKEGVLASGSNDGKVLLWDINQQTTGTVPFTSQFEGHASSVNDVAFHKSWTNVLASGDDQGNIFFWDLRDSSKYQISRVCHEGEVYSIDFSKTDEYTYVSGGSEGTVSVWDARMGTTVYQRLQGHTKHITKVEISPQRNNVIWSSSADNTLIKWDLSTKDEGEEKEGGYSKMCRYIHGGHRRAISDFDIHPSDEHKLVSVDENNQIHLFDPIEA